MEKPGTRNRGPGLLQRTLEPLAAARFVFLLVWGLITLAVWTAGLGEVELAAKISQPGLREALQFGLRILDPVLLTLCSLVVHHCTASSEGLPFARNFVLFSFGSAFLIAGCSLLFRLPLGHIAFTDRLGPTIFHVPLGWCLLCHVLSTGSRAAALVILPRASLRSVAPLSGVLAALSGANLEACTRHLRSWWICHPGILPPSDGFHAALPTTLGILSFLATFLLRPSQMKVSAPSHDRTATLVLLLLNLLFLALTIRRAIL